MEVFFVVLVVVIMLIRGLAKLGTGDGDAPPRRHAHKQATQPPKKPDVSRGATYSSRGASHKTGSASPKPGSSSSPKIRRPIFGRRPTPPGVQKPPPAQAPGSETYVRYLLDVLRVGEPAASRQAVERLVDMGRAALPTLQEAARDPSPFVRERAQQASRRILEKLALPGQPDAEPRLEEELIALPDPSPPAAPRPALFDRRREEPAPGSPPSPESPAPRADVVEVEEPAWAEEAEPAAEPAAEQERRAAPVPAVDPDEVGTIARILREAAAEPGFGGRRDEVLEPLKLVIAHFTVVVDRVQWTGAFGVSDDYRGGRTVGGRMASVDLPVAVCLPKDRNAYADALKEGATFGFRGVFACWDAMYDRGKFEGDLLEEPVAQE